MKKKVRICHLTSVHPRYDTRIFVKECRSLQAHGYDVNLVVADGLGDEIIDNIKIFDVGKTKSRLNRILKITGKVFQKAIELDTDIYHFHDPELIFAGSKLLKRRKKVIYDVHEDVPRQILTKPYIYRFLTKGISYLFEIYENGRSKRFSSIITSTSHIENRFQKINRSTVTVHNYPFLQEFGDVDANWKDREDVCCYIGGISKVRGNLENVEALKFIKKKMLLAGVFQPPQFEAELKKSEGWEFVEYLGFVDRKEVKAVLERSKVGLVTLHPTINYLDSLPVKMFEYMAAGIPVVASSFKLWKEIVEVENCGICIDPLNIKEIASAIETLINNNEMAHTMGKNGRKAVLEKYNWETEKDRLLTVYEGLL